MKRMWMCLISGLVVAVAAAAPAAAAIEITKINFNPAGRDTGSNAHLNQEFIVVENTGRRGRSLDGWKLHDAGRDHTYRFRDIRLNPGDTLTLRTGSGDDGAAVCGSPGCPVYFVSHWGLDNYVWDNDADVATLRRRDGRIADRCSYRSDASSPKRC